MPAWRDVATALLLSVSVGLLSYYGSTLVPNAVLDIYDVWFTADSPRVYANLTNQYSEQSRTKVHPLYSLLVGVPTLALRKLTKVPSPVAVQSVMSIVAALWTLTLFVILKQLGCRLIDAALFTMLGASSAAAMFWFAVPETYSAGSLTILLALLVAVVAKRANPPSLIFILVSALTMSATVTNWMVGLAVTRARFTWKQTLAITAGALVLVAMLWGLQKIIFPATPFFLPDREEADYLLLSSPGSVLQSFFFHTLVMPAIQVQARPRHVSPDAKYVLVTQSSAPGSAGPWGMTGVIAWAGLLALGLFGLWTLSDLAIVRFVLLTSVVGQLCLHLLYGAETFLYSLHFAPLLVVIAACSTLTPARPVARALGSVAVVSFLMNNVHQFQAAVDLVIAYLDRL
jgi:hypothetical protein